MTRRRSIVRPSRLTGALSIEPAVVPDNAGTRAVVFGAWLGRYVWDWFVTITFREDIETYTAMHRADEFLRRVQSAAGTRVGAFIAYEMHKWRVDDSRRRLVPHIHMLVTGVTHVWRKWAWSYSFRRNGRTRIEPFDPDLGATYYVTKYVAKECLDRGDWEIWGHWRRLPSLRR